MKILFIHSITDISGGEILLRDAIYEAKKRGHTVLVLLPNKGPLYEDLSENKIDIRVIPFRHKNKLFQPFWSVVTFPTLFGVLREFRPDIIHANDFKPALYISPVAKLLNIPVVWMVHGVWFGVESPLKRLFLSRFVSQILPVSEYVRRSFVGYRDDLFTVVYPGIDIEYFRPVLSKKKDLNKSIHIVSVGRFDPMKGFEDLIEAYSGSELLMNQASLSLVTSDFHEQTGAYKEKIIKLVSSRKKTGAEIEILPPRKDIRSIYKTGDILVSPSRFEPFGMTVIEAMASEIPVVATRSGGPEETVVDGETGLIVEIKNPLKLREALETLVLDSQKRIDFGRAGRERVKQKFSQRQYFETLFNVYKKTLQR